MIPTSISTKTGRLLRTSFLPALIGAMFLAGAAHAAEQTDSFLLPGLDMRSIEFKVGAWCRYQVVDEALGELDTSLVYLAVVGEEKTKTGRAYWLEVENTVPGGHDSDRDVARALVDERIRTMAEGDSVYHYISHFYTMKGNGPPEKGDSELLRRLTLISPAAPGDWKTESGRRVETPAGPFTCEYRSFDRSEARDIPASHVVLKQKRSDHVEVFTSSSVPLFHLVKSEIDRTRESHAVPAIKGIPETGPRQSRTTSTLMAMGTGAKPMVPLP